MLGGHQVARSCGVRRLIQVIHPCFRWSRSVWLFGGIFVSLVPNIYCNIKGCSLSSLFQFTLVSASPLPPSSAFASPLSTILPSSIASAAVPRLPLSTTPLGFRISGNWCLEISRLELVISKNLSYNAFFRTLVLVSLCFRLRRSLVVNLICIFGTRVYCLCLWLVLLPNSFSIRFAIFARELEAMFRWKMLVSFWCNLSNYFFV